MVCISYPKTVLTLLHSEQPKLHRVLAVLSAIGLNRNIANASGSISTHTPIQFGFSNFHENQHHVKFSSCISASVSLGPSNYISTYTKPLLVMLTKLNDSDLLKHKSISCQVFKVSPVSQLSTSELHQSMP